MNKLILFLILISQPLLSQIKYDEGKEPDYTQLKYWVAHPEKEDASDQIPILSKENDFVAIDLRDVDIFYVHPTTYTNKKPITWNADIDNSYLNELTENVAVKNQASIFNRVGHVYAPRYRQAHIHAYGDRIGNRKQRVFDLAYNDVQDAFHYYLKYYNEGKPFIIASHSQGTTHTKRLIAEVIDVSPELTNQMIVAYIPGMHVLKDQFENIGHCEKPTETSCFTTWRAYRENEEIPNYFIAGDNYAVSNPLTWDIDIPIGDRSLHAGAILRNFDKPRAQVLGTIASEGMLWVTRPKFPFSFLFKMKNYHILDFNFFYFNVQQNALDRVDAYLKR